MPLKKAIWRQLAILPHSGWTYPQLYRAASKRLGKAYDRDHVLQGQPFRKMPITRRHFAVLLAVMLSACSLGGCGTINEKLADGAGDYVPQWLGGLPADAPPRPGTAKYDAYMQERERKRLEPAPPKGDAAAAPGSSTSGSSAPAASASTSSSGLDAIH
jgi:hypothetical protein